MGCLLSVLWLALGIVLVLIVATAIIRAMAIDVDARLVNAAYSICGLIVLVSFILCVFGGVAPYGWWPGRCP